MSEKESASPEQKGLKKLSAKAMKAVKGGSNTCSGSTVIIYKGRVIYLKAPWAHD